MQDKPVRAFGDIDILVKEVPNKYLLVNVARVRAQQLVAHIAEPMVDGANPEKAVSAALNEIADGKLEILPEAPPAAKDAEPPEEIEAAEPAAED